VVKGTYYSEALEVHAALLRWIALPQATDYAAAVLGSGQWAQALGSILRRAATFSVTAEITDVLESSSRGLPEVHLRADLLPEQYGICVFERPITLGTGRGRDGLFVAPLVRGLCWGIGMRRSSGSAEGRPVLYPLVDVPQRGGGMAPVPFAVFEWGFGESQRAAARREVVERRADPLDQAARAAWFLDLFATLCLFLQQRVVVAPRQLAERHARKRLARSGFEGEPFVRVVELRRSVSAPRAGRHEQDVAWSCRWLVRGHWRAQPYLKAGMRGATWISPYVKGPLHAPFRMPKRPVFAVVR
jgi:hypothetical protein